MTPSPKKHAVPPVVSIRIGAPPPVEFLAARLHGRLPRMLRKDRLDAACALATATDLTQFRFGDAGPDHRNPLALERRATAHWAAEVRRLADALTPPGSALLRWCLDRLQVANAKILVRAVRVPRPSGPGILPLLADLPPIPGPTAEAFRDAPALSRFRDTCPIGPFRHYLGLAMRYATVHADPFLAEAALDRDYWVQGFSRATDVPCRERKWTTALLDQEIQVFHLQLVALGRFVHHLPTSALIPLHVPGTRLSASRFRGMLEAPDLASALRSAQGIALDEWTVPPDPTTAPFEGRHRLHRIALRALRGSVTGLGAILAYALLRDLERTNLVTLAEGIRSAGIGPLPTIRTRLIPRPEPEAPHA